MYQKTVFYALFQTDSYRNSVCRDAWGLPSTFSCWVITWPEFLFFVVCQLRCLNKMKSTREEPRVKENARDAEKPSVYIPFYWQVGKSGFRGLTLPLYTENFTMSVIYLFVPFKQWNIASFILWLWFIFWNLATYKKVILLPALF